MKWKQFTDIMNSISGKFVDGIEIFGFSPLSDVKLRFWDEIWSYVYFLRQKVRLGYNIENKVWLTWIKR